MNQTLGNIFGERRQKSIAGKYVRSQNAAATLWNAELPVKPTVSRRRPACAKRLGPGSRSRPNIMQNPVSGARSAGTR
jgi:hypothetical protein